MRMTEDVPIPQDMAIALSWNLKTGVTHALLLGCIDHDLDQIWKFLKYSIPVSGHPLLLLGLFSKLQLKRLKKLRLQAQASLVAAIHKAGLNRQTVQEVIAAPAVLAGSEEVVDYDEVIRDILGNFRDSGYILQAMNRSRSQVLNVIADIKMSDAELSREQNELLALHGKQISSYLITTLGHYDRIIERARLTTDESSLLMSAMWNLIAQKENKISQAIAEESKNIAKESKRIATESKSLAESSTRLAADSKEIAEDSKMVAEATRWDSTSMKAIATLTMVFLPPTYAAVSLQHLGARGYEVIQLILSRRFWRCPCSIGNVAWAKVCSNFNLSVYILQLHCQ